MAPEVTRQLGESIQDFTKRRALTLQRAPKGSSSDSNNGGGGGGNNREPTGKFYYRYPQDAIFETTDYMRFTVVRYIPPGLSKAAITAASNKTAPLFSATSTDEAIRARAKVDSKTMRGIIDLPMPLALADANQVSWSDGNMNSIAALVGSFAQQLMNSEGDYTQNAIQGIRNLQQRFSQAGMGGMVQVAQSALVSMMINMVPGAQLSFTDTLARTQGVVINPNTEFLFRGPQLRKFSFAFTFVARSEKEGEEIKQIIRHFKKHMSPKKTLASNLSGAGGGFLQSPDVFQIQYMTGSNEHNFLNKFKYCALQNMTVNYSNGSGYISYEDGTPVIVTMVLAFNELTPVYAEDYDSKLGQGGVGF